MAPSRGGLVIFSGGSAANSLVDVFENIRLSRDCSLSYIIPISDNGGSTSELIRVFGGPGIGDVRSRLVRLIPGQPHSKEREAIGTLMSSRLSGTDTSAARHGWSDIVDGTSELWRGIPSAKKELIRAFFNLVNLEILKRSRPPTSTFDFRSASIGNLFLTGARLFSGSFESSIYLLSSVCGIPDEQIKVIPSINSNFSHHIAAELEDGTVIVGQNSISHPSVIYTGSVVQVTPQPDYQVTSADALSEALNAANLVSMPDDETTSPDAEDAHPPFTLQTLRASNITFTKTAEELEELPSRISRIHYVNSFGQEILPPANPRAIQAINQAQAIIYSIGSLYTSIVPNLVLRGIGEAMHKSPAQFKILLLNGCLDREVGADPSGVQFTAADFIDAIVKAGEQSRGVSWSPSTRNSNRQSTSTSPSSDRPPFNRALSDGRTLRTTLRLDERSFPPPMLASTMPSRANSPKLSPNRANLSSVPTNNHVLPSGDTKNTYRSYITHLIHLPNTTETPYVDNQLLHNDYGIHCIRVYGRRNNSGPGMLYDAQALQGALITILGSSSSNSSNGNGTNTSTKFGDRGRRNTVDG